MTYSIMIDNIRYTETSFDIDVSNHDCGMFLIMAFD